MKKGFTIVVFLVVVFLIHLVNDVAKRHGVVWYESLHLPVWAPTVTGLTRIWAAMFIFKTVAGALLWVAHKAKARTLALELWFAHLALDSLWHFLFFYLHDLFFTSVTFGVLILAIALLLYVSKKVDKAAFCLLIPYEIWLVYALALNIALLAMN